MTYQGERSTKGNEGRKIELYEQYKGANSKEGIFPHMSNGWERKKGTPGMAKGPMNGGTWTTWIGQYNHPSQEKEKDQGPPSLEKKGRSSQIGMEGKYRSDVTSKRVARTACQGSSYLNSKEKKRVPRSQSARTKKRESGKIVMKGGGEDPL